MANAPCSTCGRDLDEHGRCPRCDSSTLPLGPVSEPLVEVRAVAQTTILTAADTNPAPAPVVDEPKPANPLAPPRIPATTVRPPVATVSATPQGAYSASNMTAIADRAQLIAMHSAWICALFMIAVVSYINHPLESPPSLPTGIATMVTPPKGPQIGDSSSYIAMLQKIDLQRVGLVSNLDQALSSSGSPAGTQTAGPSGGLSQSARDLVTDFLAQKPPPDCSDLSNTYFRLIQDQTAMIAKCDSALSTGNVPSAIEERDESASQISQDAQAADAALGQVCSTQRVNKPFNVVADPGQPSAPPASPQSNPNQMQVQPQPQPSTPATPAASPSTSPTTTPDNSNENSGGPAPVSG
jgi:hypothetical protein